MRPRSQTLLLVLDFAGTLVFAIEGGLAAAAGRLDVLGLIVLAFVTAVGGGVVRDLLIGAVPPQAIRDWRYAALAFAGAAIVFFWRQSVQGVPPAVITGLDAAGLSLFAVAGAAKALDYHIHPLLAVLLGTITGVGGGTIRDVLLARIPTVLRADVYASAALAGAAVLVIGIRLKGSPTFMAILGVAVCFALRMMAVSHHWSLPQAAR